MDLNAWNILTTASDDHVTLNKYVMSEGTLDSNFSKGAWGTKAKLHLSFLACKAAANSDCFLLNFLYMFILQEPNDK